MRRVDDQLGGAVLWLPLQIAGQLVMIEVQQMRSGFVGQGEAGLLVQR